MVEGGGMGGGVAGRSTVRSNKSRREMCIQYSVPAACWVRSVRLTGQAKPIPDRRQRSEAFL